MIKRLKNAITLHLSAVMSECGETCMVQRCYNLETAHRALRLGYAVMIRRRQCGYEIIFLPTTEPIQQLIRP